MISAGLGDRPVHRLHRVEVAVAPAHEGLRVDVLVVLGEVEPAAERLEDDAAVVLGRQAELGLDRGAEQRAPELVEVLALHDDAVRRALERLDVVRRDAQVLEPQRPEGLEAEDVADDRGGHVRDRALLEQVEVVGDLRDVLVLATGHRLHGVRLGLVVAMVGQAVGPDHGPRRRGGFAGHRRRGLDRVDAGLRRDPERGQDVGVLRLVVRVVVAHLRVRRDAGRPAVFLLDHAGEPRAERFAEQEKIGTNP